MTHRFPLSLLEDFVDNELSEEDAEAFRRQLERSPELRQQYEEAVRLKELLGHMPAHDPGEDYWSEVTDLILARTSGLEASETETEPENISQISNRRAFYRSLVSVAAALFIFFTALIIGSNRQQELPTAKTAPQPILVTAALAERFENAGNSYMTKSERTFASVGMMLIGSPSHVGRFAAIPELLDID
jgi:anti-sigma factor RsiW